MSALHTLDLEFREPATSPEFSRVMTYRGFTVAHTSMKLPMEYEYAWSGGAHYLARHDLVLERGELTLDGGEPITRRDLRNTMTFVPEGRALTGWAAPVDRANSFTIINFDPGSLDEELELAFSERDLDASVYFENEILATTMRKIEQELVHGGSGLYLETLGMVAAIEASRLKSEQLQGAAFRRGGLNRIQIKLLTDYIDAHLAEDVSLDRLAGLVGLSRFHFSRSFKAAFGVSPVKYVTARRLTQAKVMLAGPRIGLMDVASAVGFGSVQQFIKVFRDDTRMTPGEYRRNL